MQICNLSYKLDIIVSQVFLFGDLELVWIVECMSVAMMSNVCLALFDANSNSVSDRRF
jgi:hypothetical protein